MTTSNSKIRAPRKELVGSNGFGTLEFWTPQQFQDKRMVVRMSDDKGWDVHPVDHVMYNNSVALPVVDRAYTFELSPKPTTATLEVSVQKSVYMHFTVKPRVVSTNEDLRVWTRRGEK
jgi:hypothetical protein